MREFHLAARIVLGHNGPNRAHRQAAEETRVAKVPEALQASLNREELAT